MPVRGRPFGKRHREVVALAEQGPITTQGLAQALNVSPDNASLLLHRACKRNALERRNKPGSRGYVYVRKA